MRPCTSRWAPSAGSPRRRVHEGGSSEEWRSYTALGPDACVQAGKVRNCHAVLLLTPPRLVSTPGTLTERQHRAFEHDKMQNVVLHYRQKGKTSSSRGSRPSVGENCSPMPTQGLRLGRSPARVGKVALGPKCGPRPDTWPLARSVALGPKRGPRPEAWPWARIWKSYRAY